MTGLQPFNAHPQALRPPFTKVFVDISGDREVGVIMRLLQVYEAAMDPKPELFVVKSQKLKQVLVRSQLWADCKREPRKPQHWSEIYIVSW